MRNHLILAIILTCSFVEDAIKQEFLLNIQKLARRRMTINTLKSAAF